MAPACRCLWCAFFSSFAAVLLGNTTISGSALRMNSTAWWLISLLFCIFTYTDLTLALVLGTLTIAHTNRSDMAGARRRIFDVSSLQFLEVAELVQSPKGAPSGQHVPEEEEDQAPEVQAAQPGLWGGALRSDILHFLRRQPSQALDDGQLALYLQFRGVSFDTVMDWGVYF